MQELFGELSTSTRSVPYPGLTSDRNGDDSFSLELELVVHDRDVIRVLAEYAEGDERNRFALEALKIGVLAMRHVGGQATADLVQREVRNMQRTLEQHHQLVHSQLATTLKDYFDPQDGRFSQRVQGLVSHDGELSQLIKGHIDGEHSLFARTLIAYVGRDSPLMKHLDPEQAKGLLATLRQSVDAQLSSHGSQMLKEFSLDNKEGALSRFIGELTTKHGNLAEALQTRVDVLAKELSLNEPNSALNRLVQNVTHAQRTITNEFSLDSETSCLSRLKRELMTILEAHVKTNNEFQEEVKGALRELTARREEQDRSTIHGGTFQSAVFEFLHCQAQQQGDICDFTGDRVGAIKNCKMGDVVVKLGTDTSAPGSCITFEAKEDKAYTLAAALSEIEQARKNRLSEVGVFVFSKKTAPKGLRSLRRFGNDIVVVWDANDALSDAFLLASLELARLMCLCRQRQLDSQTSDFTAIETAILDIEKRAANLDKICKYAKTIQAAGGKVLHRAQIDRKSLGRQINVLREKVAELRGPESNNG
jgi:hypothetical protein